jgi:hypothetical protein
LTLLEPGHIFAARYRVDRCLAGGDGTALFEAFDTATERRVALELLLLHGSRTRALDAEPSIGGGRSSAGPLDAGFDEATGAHYLVMALLDGQPLVAPSLRCRAFGASEVPAEPDAPWRTGVQLDRTRPPVRVAARLPPPPPAELAVAPPADPTTPDPTTPEPITPEPSMRGASMARASERFAPRSRRRSPTARMRVAGAAAGVALLVGLSLWLDAGDHDASDARAGASGMRLEARTLPVRAEVLPVSPSGATASAPADARPEPASSSSASIEVGSARRVSGIETTEIVLASGGPLAPPASASAAGAPSFPEPAAPTAALSDAPRTVASAPATSAESPAAARTAEGSAQPHETR